MEAATEPYVYVWEFELVPEKKAEFLRFYGPAGMWAGLFRQASGYIETLLLHDRTNPARYLTIDRWTTSEAHQAFLAKFRGEYEELDSLCGCFTSHEASLGTYWECTDRRVA